jgi:hypothetical protein
VTYVYPEPYTGNNWLVRYLVVGKINFVSGSVIGVVAIIWIVGMSIGLFLAFRRLCNRAD